MIPRDGKGEVSFKISLSSSNDEIINRSTNFCDKCVDKSSIVISILPKTVRDGVFDCNDRDTLSALTFHIGMRDIEGNRHGFRAVFQLGTLDIFRRAPVLIILPKPSDFEVNHRDRRHDGKKEFVFIGIIDVSEDRERMNGIGRERMMIGLHRFDGVEQLDSNWSKCLSLVGVGSSIPERKSELFAPGRKDPVEFIQQDRPERMIESASEIVNDVRNNQRPADDIGFVISSDDNASAGALWIDMRTEAIRYRVMPGPNFIVESIEQFFGSANL